MSSNWDFYFCNVAGQVHSVFVDLSLTSDVPIQDLETSVRLRLVMRDPKENGLSSERESATLFDLEDSLMTQLDDQNLSFRFVGRTTGGGVRDFYFYVRDVDSFESAVGEVFHDFSEYDFQFMHCEDACYEIYREFLLPSDREMQAIRNRRLFAQLKDHGDQFELKRDVDHTFHFHDEDSLESFLGSLDSDEWRVTSREFDEAENPRFRLVVTEHRALDQSEMDRLCVELVTQAERFSGSYDGWGCLIQSKS